MSDPTQTQQLAISASADMPTEVQAPVLVTDSRPLIRNPFAFFSKGKGPRFADETESLLRSRLKAAALDLVVVLGIGYVGNWLAGSTQWQFFRSAILASVITSLFLLRSRIVLGMGRLRIIELILFGGVAIQMGLMMYSRIGHFAKLGEAASMVSVQQFFFTAFCLHILTYGIFMPNNWRRAAVITTILALIPYGVWYLHLNTNPLVVELNQANHAGSPLPVTLIAALIGTYGSHIIQRTRREAFQAKQIMQYRLHEQIGSGGMGDVYRAEHVLMKRPCAMKLIKPEKGNSPTTLERFEREVIATARLTHWNTIDIFDYGRTEDGTFYYVMELLRGESLQELVVRYGVLSPARTVYLLAQACDALEEAHQAGMIHRDIKPANIFAAFRGGEWDVCKLLDFGLVKESSTGIDENATKAGSFSGTPAFMAPEQVLRYDEVDGRTDLYAIGAVAYFLLTGRPPFIKSNTLELLAAHATELVIPPSQLRPEIPLDLDKVVLQCLAKYPESRFDSARSLGIALRQCDCSGEWNAEKASQWWTIFGAEKSRSSSDDASQAETRYSSEFLRN